VGLYYNRRINLGKGIGVNISKSGLSTSYRTKFGSVSSKGFSIRTGIPGLSFRSYGKNSGPTALIILVVLSVVIVCYYIGLGVVWMAKELYKAFLRFKYRRELAHLGFSENEIGVIEQGEG
jgi:hypothetical protein